MLKMEIHQCCRADPAKVAQQKTPWGCPALLKPFSSSLRIGFPGIIALFWSNRIMILIIINENTIGFLFAGAENRYLPRS